MEVISKTQAAQEGKTHYFTGEQCKRGHLSFRLVSTRQCLECCKEAAQAYRNKNAREQITYFKDTPCKHGHVGLWYYKTHSCKTCKDIRDAEYRINNREKVRETLRRFKQRNPHKVNADTAKRRAAKKRATPNWLTKEMRREIVKLYKESILKRKATGIEHHVDHIVPLASDVVCGLHVPWNLQVLTEQKNLAKSNKLVELE